MSLGAKIRERRKALKFSLQQLADKTHSSKSYIWELENSDTKNFRPSAKKINDIAAAIGVTSEWLLSDEVNSDEAKDMAFFNKFKTLPDNIKQQIIEITSILNQGASK